MQVRIQEVGDGHDEANDVEELPGSSLMECVALRSDLTVEELKDRITTGEWFGGVWKRDCQTIVFETDTFDVVFSLA